MTEERLTVVLDGRPVPLRIRRNGQAKRLILRIDPQSDGASVTLPRGVRPERAVALLRDQAAWVLDRLADLPPRVPFADGESLPVLGETLRIRHCPGARRPVLRADGEIVVSGRAEHLARRLEDWLRAEARRRITALADDKAARLGVRRGRISLRDTRSRWGSCAADGGLSFCWRLVMAPPWVIDYVAAHEVAHLRHRHHQPEFWRTVDELTDHTAAARDWLDVHGRGLHRYGGNCGASFG